MHDFKYLVSFQVANFVPGSKDFGHFHLDGANLQMRAHFVPEIRHQNLAII